MLKVIKYSKVNIVILLSSTKKRQDGISTTTGGASAVRLLTYIVDGTVLLATHMGSQGHNAVGEACVGCGKHGLM